MGTCGDKQVKVQGGVLLINTTQLFTEEHAEHSNDIWFYSQTQNTDRWNSPDQRQFNLGGKGLLVVGGLDEDDDGCGHGFSQLVRPDGVVLQWQVGEGHEAAEAQRQQHNPANWEALWGEHVHFVADVESQPGDHKVNEGQGHVGEPVVYVDPLVDENYADGGEQVDQQADDNAFVGR